MIGEWVLGSVRPRDVVPGALRDLPHAAVATDDEMFAFIERERLFGLGIGYVDSHLLAAIRLMHGGASVVTEQKARCGGGPTRAGHGTDEGMTTEGTHNRDLPTLGAWGAFDRPGPDRSAHPRRTPRRLFLNRPPLLRLDALARRFSFPDHAAHLVRHLTFNPFATEHAPCRAVVEVGVRCQSRGSRPAVQPCMPPGSFCLFEGRGNADDGPAGEMTDRGRAVGFSRRGTPAIA